ncbi:MAG: hypothetical protein KME29_40160 [Calothrix sp. FI2-JRJ7]|nr:hypothetical protein [Calothrix sp. FI2-JRJ7]
MIHLFVEGQSWQRVINGCNGCRTGASTFGRNIIIRRQKPYYMVGLKKPICQKWMFPVGLTLRGT